MAEVGAQHVSKLWIHDFRCIEALEVNLHEGLTVIVGRNGQGKTSLLEAIGWPALASSLRNVADVAIVRAGCDQAIVRSEIVDGDRTKLFEAEIRASGRNRMMVNSQTVQKRRDLFGVLRTTVFAPDDVQLVKGSPSGRREYLDALLTGLTPRYVAAISDYERILKQRNALLKQAARDRSAIAMMGPFNEQLVATAAEIIRGRQLLLQRLLRPLEMHYEALGEGSTIGITYRAEWSEDLSVETELDGLREQLFTAIDRRSQQELDRQITLVGPHRDDVLLSINGLDARTQASQGEQRSLALSMRLAGHAVTTDMAGSAPVLLLDDVFSELDHQRACALVELLPKGQTIVSTATEVPPEISVQQAFEMISGKLTER